MTRLNKIQEQMKEFNFSSILVMNPNNLRYVADFTGTSGYAFITQDTGYFITDSRYTEQASRQASDYQIVDHGGQVFQSLAELAEKEDVDEVGVEEESMTVRQWDDLDDVLPCPMSDSSGLVESLREIKEDNEIATISKAVEIAEAAFVHILDYIQVGMSEIQVANELDFYMRGLGASGTSFDTIVASGYRSAMPHGVASEKVIENNELVTIDFGCYYQGYVSDMTRTFAIGKVDQELVDIYHIVKEAHEKVKQAASSKITGQDLDSVARDHIESQGYGPQFGHTTGHGIGLEIHEGPTVSSRNTDYFVANNVITNEPGIYLPGRGGVRIENDLVITDQGCQDLMSVPIDFIEL